MEIAIIKDEIIFWILFFGFNFSLFAFNYFINIKESSFFPLLADLKRGKIGVFINYNPDFFRISIDFSLAILFVRYGIISNGIWIIGALYGFMIIFNLYHYSFRKIYQSHPIFINDLRLIKNGAAILWDESKGKLISYVVMAITVVVLLCLSFYHFLQYSLALKTNISTHVGSILLVAIIMTALFIKGHKPVNETYQRFFIHTLRIVYHIIDSRNLVQKRKNLNTDILDQKRNSKFKLVRRPNIYLVFIESYGSILLRDRFLESHYNKEFHSFSNKLLAHNWSCKSHLSASVSLIGPSWLAYSSVLLGQRVDNNFWYEFLMNEKKLYKYDTIQKVLQKQGYKSFNLNASMPKTGINVPFNQMREFYGIDDWILRSDIEYNGTTFGFTEVPPDQFVLNYAYENVLSKQTDPCVLFYLTKNSHSPFISPSKTLANWKDWNETEDKLIGNKFLQQPNKADFLGAIKHQMEFLSDFIIQSGGDDDIFLLIGDHQPHVLADQDHGFETIVHVISRDRAFLNGFVEYGFSDELCDTDHPIKHEAIYSIFIRELIKSYGQPDTPLPDYEPHGLQF